MGIYQYQTKYLLFSNLLIFYLGEDIARKYRLGRCYLQNTWQEKAYLMWGHFITDLQKVNEQLRADILEETKALSHVPF